MKNGRLWSLGLLSLAALWVAGGCAALSVSPTPAVKPTPDSTPKPVAKTSEATSKSAKSATGSTSALPTGSSLSDPCPTGNCDPIGNGEGLYFAKDSNANYCLVNGPDHFFPEAFVNAEGGVVLVGRAHHGGARADWKNPPSVVTRNVFVSPVNGGPASRMASMTSEDGELAITYGAGGAEHAAGEELEGLVIQIMDDASGRSSTNLRVTLVAGSKQYTVKYGHSAGHLNQDLCTGEPVSFLPGKRIEAGSGRVGLASGTTTLSCNSGAIAKCMGLSYAEPHAGVSPDDVNRLFASCLQGIRATYLMGEGDFTSYTKDGTQILVNDPYIRVGEMNYIEALWTPQGPHCVNVDHLRRQIPERVVNELRAKLPACTGDLQPTNPVKLVTGPADQSSQPRVALGSH